MKEKRLQVQTEFYTNLNKKVDVILFFIYWTKHVHVMLNNILGDDAGAQPSHCTVGPAVLEKFCVVFYDLYTSSNSKNVTICQIL